MSRNTYEHDSYLDTLSLPREEFRRLGYKLIDRLIDHATHLRERPVTYQVERAALEESLSEPPPEDGMDADAVLQTLEKTVLANIVHVDHPRFFAYIPGPTNTISVLADLLATGLNVFCGTWLASAGPTQVELVVIDWLRQLCGLPESTGGLFVSGGSMANVTALAVARQVRLGGRNDNAVVYCSDQTHASVARGLRLLGFQPEQCRTIRTDGAFRIDLDVLRGAVEQDQAAGRKPFCVVANAGTTNTGAVDPLRELAALCAQQGLWLHADGAYGAAAVLCDEGRLALDGLEQVDSLTLDPHKWLFQPFESGCVLIREGVRLGETFRLHPEYMQDAHEHEPETNFCDYGVQLTRSARALKLWASLKVFGLSAFRSAIERGFELARFAERELRSAGCWEIVTPAQMAMLSFRYAPADAPAEKLKQVNEHLVAAIFADGYTMLSSTQLRGRTVLRLCPINPRTTDEDVRSALERVEAIARRLLDEQ